MQWLPSPSRVGDDSAGSASGLARFGHTCVSVDARHSWGTELLVLFGGVTQGPSSPRPLGQLPLQQTTEQHQATNEVLVLTGDGDAWFRPNIQGEQPPARAFHSAAVIGSLMYVFGGHVLQSEEEHSTRKKRIFFNDMWALDTESWTWQRVELSSAHSPSDLPPRRDMATLTPIGNEALLLFAGRNESGRTLGDTWIYDIENARWHQLKVGGVHPVPRKMHAAVYVNGRVLVLGGERDSGALDDLWSLRLPPPPLAAWLPLQLAQQEAQAHAAPLLANTPGQGDDLCRWTQIRVRPTPTARFGHSLTLCGNGRLVLSFGGCQDTAGFLALTHSFVQCSETWVLDLASFSWQKESPAVLGLDTQSPPATHTTSSPTAPTTHTHTSSSGGAATESVIPGPSERMCHTMTALTDGRLLLLGGRRKEGICKDGWWLHLDDPKKLPLPQPPTDPSAAAKLALGNAATAATAAAAAAPALLKSIFNPNTKPGSSNTALTLAAQTQAQPVLLGGTSLSGSLAASAGPATPSASFASLPQAAADAAASASQTPRRPSASGGAAPIGAAAAASAASAAMGKLAGLIAGRPQPPDAAAAGGAEDAAAAVAATGTSPATAWLQSVPASLPNSGQIMGKLNALKAAIPWPPAAPAAAAAAQPPRPFAQGQGVLDPRVSVQGWGGVGQYEGGGIQAHQSVVSSVQSIDYASAMAVQAAADAADYESFRETILNLPPTPHPAHLPSRAPPPPPSQPAPTALAALQARGLQLSSGQQRGGPSNAVNIPPSGDAAVSMARAHLASTPVESLTIADVELLLQDMVGLVGQVGVQRARDADAGTGSAGHPALVGGSEGARKDSGGAGSAMQELQRGLGELESVLGAVHLLQQGGSGVRVGDVPVLVSQYRALCGRVGVV